MIEAERMDSIVSAVVCGLTKQEAALRGLLPRDEERELWDDVVAYRKKIKRLKGELVPVENTWF